MRGNYGGNIGKNLSLEAASKLKLDVRKVDFLNNTIRFLIPQLHN